MNNIKKISYILVSCICALVLYIFLHEFGHTIIMLLAGAKIVNFSILNAHVVATGGEYNEILEMLLHISGALLPVIVSFIYILLYKKDTKNNFYIMFSYVFSITPIASLLAWVMIPFLYMNNSAPVSDDVTKFLNTFSNYYPVISVSISTILIIIFLILLIIKKNIFKNFFNLMKNK